MKQISIKLRFRSILQTTVFIILSLLCMTNLFCDNLKNIQEIVSKYNQSTLYQIEIQQENHYMAQNKTLKSHGYLYRDNQNYLIIFDKPYKQFIKFTDSQVTVYDSSVKTAYLIPFSKFPSFNPAVIFREIENGKISLKNKQNPFNISFISLNQYFDFLTIDFDFKGKYIKSISYQDQLNNKVIIHFINQRFNKKHKLDIPNYTYPPDTKLFKQ